MSWEAYNAHGGPVEDALTFELLHILAGVKTLGVMLFNPKLVTAGTSGRRSDVCFDSNVHCCVECVLTKSNTEWYHRDVEKHVLRFSGTKAVNRITRSKVLILLFFTFKTGETRRCSCNRKSASIASMKEYLRSSCRRSNCFQGIHALRVKTCKPFQKS